MGKKMPMNTYNMSNELVILKVALYIYIYIHIL